LVSPPSHSFFLIQSLGLQDPGIPW
jgi:hypothetical protein